MSARPGPHGLDSPPRLAPSSPEPGRPGGARCEPCPRACGSPAAVPSSEAPGPGLGRPCPRSWPERSTRAGKRALGEERHPRWGQKRSPGRHPTGTHKAWRLRLPAAIGLGAQDVRDASQQHPRAGGRHRSGPSHRRSLPAGYGTSRTIAYKQQSRGSWRGCARATASPGGRISHMCFGGHHRAPQDGSQTRPGASGAFYFPVCRAQGLAVRSAPQRGNARGGKRDSTEGHCTSRDKPANQDSGQTVCLAGRERAEGRVRPRRQRSANAALAPGRSARHSRDKLLETPSSLGG